MRLVRRTAPARDAAEPAARRDEACAVRAGRALVAFPGAGARRARAERGRGRVLRAPTPHALRGDLPPHAGARADPGAVEGPGAPPAPKGAARRGARRALREPVLRRAVRAARG